MIIYQTMVFLWFSYGFPMVFPLKPPFSYGFPLVFPLIDSFCHLNQQVAWVNVGLCWWNHFFPWINHDGVFFLIFPVDNEITIFMIYMPYICHFPYMFAGCTIFSGISWLLELAMISRLGRGCLDGPGRDDPSAVVKRWAGGKHG